ncbi:MAG: hypothetical protein AAF578_04630 [Pseudomonadota bacterium]
MSYTSQNAAFDATVIVFLDASKMRGSPAYRSGMKPNHRIDAETNDYFTGELTFRDREWLQPGESCEATGTFTVAKKDLELFVPGFRWELCEGRMAVGYAKLVERGEAKPTG